MGVPKRRTSKSKIKTRQRTTDRKRRKAAVQKCPQCGAVKQPHRVCKACGYYAKRQVLTVSAEA